MFENAQHDKVTIHRFTWPKGEGPTVREQGGGFMRVAYAEFEEFSDGSVYTTVKGQKLLKDMRDDTRSGSTTGRAAMDVIENFTRDYPRHTQSVG